MNVTRHIAVIDNELTIVRRMENVTYFDERTGRFIKVEDIQEVGRDAHYWDTVDNLAFAMVNGDILEPAELNEVCEYFDPDKQIAHEMWQEHSEQLRVVA